MHTALLASLTSTALLCTAPALAQDNCAARDQVLDRLAQTYGETRQSIGLTPNNGVVEVFASEATGTWTILFTRPDGLSCLIASGQAYETLATAPVAKGDDV
ncbi:hypothetical protein [Celeribacter ethanolicus]|uniref:hypothetical protein n=1 Tax=Celeribacter ethanolicus TaxID=1758178 RepID=UPI00082B1997|nr:hypothetical protein [Celeribacter ethanolicus]